MEELIEKVWSNQEFQLAAGRVQRAWIARETGATTIDLPDLAVAKRVVQAAAILACSAKLEHRLKAYRAATSSFELYGDLDVPFNQATRVVLSRLGNFPAIFTRGEVADAVVDLPPQLVAEEFSAKDGRTISIRSRDVVLTDFQHRLWRKLEAGQRLAVAAPTSAGKSFVLQNFIASHFETTGRRAVVYLVPTRALITQVSDDLRQLLSRHGETFEEPVEVITVPVEADMPLPPRSIYVLTQERAQLLLSSHLDFVGEVIVVDEAQSVADGSRGVLLQTVVEDLLKRRPEAQLLFASPGVRNLDVFGRMLGRSDIEALRSREPAVAQNFLMVDIEDADSGFVSLHYIEKHRPREWVADFGLGKRTVTRIEKLVNVAVRMGQGGSNIIYANGPGDAEAIALRLADRFADRNTNDTREKLAGLVADAVHPQYALVECVKKGVAFHYSNMPSQVRQAVEHAVAVGDVDYLVCTSTLLQGVNLPAKKLFMCRPEKGQYIPLESVDFWNLAGRAGRLLKEFQGNIFLIDYVGWHRKPLDQPRDAIIVPAIERSVASERSKLIAAISQGDARGVDNPDVAAVFVRLLNDRAAGTLPEMMRRIREGQGLDAKMTDAVEHALAMASKAITLPAAVLRQSADISAHKQQHLYDVLARRAKVSNAAARALLPKVPQDRGAYTSYETILKLCHRIIAGRKRTSKLHRFHALLALRWMQGHALPRIVQNQLNRNPDKDPRAVVRETLELVERDIRYRCVRLFSCYSAVLGQVLADVGRHQLIADMPSIPLFLELGASDRTSIALMSLGISRPAATRLAVISRRPGLSSVEAHAWLQTLRPDHEGMSTILWDEVRRVLEPGVPIYR